MGIQNIEATKLALIQWIAEIEDFTLLQKIQNLKTGVYSISESQKNEVREELGKYRRGEVSGIDADEFLESLRKRNE